MTLEIGNDEAVTVESDSETVNDNSREDDDVKPPNEKLMEIVEERDNVDHIPEDACNRWEVCENTCIGDTCSECWTDIRKQLETPDGGCPECSNQYFKFVPAGEDCGIKCKECGWLEWQTIEYRAGKDKSDWEKAREHIQ